MCLSPLLSLRKRKFLYCLKKSRHVVSRRSEDVWPFDNCIPIVATKSFLHSFESKRIGIVIEDI